MRFVKDAVINTYERSVFSVLDFTGNLGGLFEVLEITGSIIVGLFSSKLFFYSFLSRLYQVDKTSKGKH